MEEVVIENAINEGVDNKSTVITNNPDIISPSASTEFRLGELFCGPGGIAYGALHSKSKNNEYSVKHVWANDYDYDTCKTYLNNICPENPDSVICEDVRILDFNRLKEISEIDGLAFGFPCNDYSLVGQRKGIDGNFGPLYKYGIQALKEFRPLWFIAENVSGIRSSGKGETFQIILSEMAQAGYKIKPHLYKFENYGVPQSRHRVIIVGIRDDLEGIDFQIPSPKPYKQVDVSCRNAIENPPISNDAPNNERTSQSKKVIRRLQYIQPGENAFNANLPDDLKLNISGVTLSQIYRRLDPDKPAYTVTGSGGGGTHMYHWSEDRALTNRERARLQTFPDDYVFSGSKESVRKQIGMAVPPKGVQIIIEAILNTFAKQPYESVPQNIPFNPSLFDFYNN